MYELKWIVGKEKENGNIMLHLDWKNQVQDDEENVLGYSFWRINYSDRIKIHSIPSIFIPRGRW